MTAIFPLRLALAITNVVKLEREPKRERNSGKQKPRDSNEVFEADDIEIYSKLSLHVDEIA